MREHLVEFLKALHAAGLRARKRTESERKRALIDFSLHHDFRDGFRPREHLCDAYSLASQEYAKLTPLLSVEKRDQEAVYLKEVLGLIDVYKSRLEERLMDLDGQRAPFALLERQRVLREARHRIAGQK